MPRSSMPSVSRSRCPPQALHHFTQADQVNQLVGAGPITDQAVFEGGHRVCPR